MRQAQSLDAHLGYGKNSTQVSSIAISNKKGYWQGIFNFLSVIYASSQEEFMRYWAVEVHNKHIKCDPCMGGNNDLCSFFVTMARSSRLRVMKVVTLHAIILITHNNHCYPAIR